MLVVEVYKKCRNAFNQQVENVMPIAIQVDGMGNLELLLDLFQLLGDLVDILIEDHGLPVESFNALNIGRVQWQVVHGGALVDHQNGLTAHNFQLIDDEILVVFLAFHDLDCFDEKRGYLLWILEIPAMPGLHRSLHIYHELSQVEGSVE